MSSMVKLYKLILYLISLPPPYLQDMEVYFVQYLDDTFI